MATTNVVAPLVTCMLFLFVAVLLGAYIFTSLRKGTCREPGCDNERFFRTYCVQHSCPHCSKRRGAGLDGVCEDHVCRFDGCERGTPRYLSFCAKHLCPYPGCGSARVWDGPPCSKHVCFVDNCFGVRETETRSFCVRHRHCIVQGCQVVALDSNLCSRHKSEDTVAKKTHFAQSNQMSSAYLEGAEDAM